MARSPLVRLLLLVALGALLFLVPPRHPESSPSPQASQAEPHKEGEHEHVSFADVDRWVHIFDSPDRDEWQMPERVIEALGIRPGNTVADLGAGTGYFTIHLARAVAPGGKVLAIDTEPNMVDYLGQRAEHEGVPGVEPVLAAPDDPRIPKGSADCILIVNTYHHIHDRTDYFARLREALAPGGRVAIVDYVKKTLPVGPPPEEKMSREEVVGEMEKAGYRLAGEETFLPYQYFVSFTVASDRD